jgi:hypothetical protein
VTRVASPRQRDEILDGGARASCAARRPARDRVDELSTRSAVNETTPDPREEQLLDPVA